MSASRGGVIAAVVAKHKEREENNEHVAAKAEAECVATEMEELAGMSAMQKNVKIT